MTEILVGGNAWRGRGLLGRLAAALGGNAVHVPWSEVADVGSVVELKRTAPELRLGRGDDRAGDSSSGSRGPDAALRAHAPQRRDRVGASGSGACTTSAASCVAPGSS